MKDLSADPRDLALRFLSANDTAIRQNDVASLAPDVCRSSREADDTPIKRKNRGNSRKERDEGGEGRGGERENLDPRVSARPHQGPWAILAAANAWRILEGESAGRRLMILACGSKKKRGTGEEGRVSVQVGKKKRRGRTYRFLPFAHTDTSADSRVSSRVLPVCVGGPRSHVRVCPPKTGRSASVPAWRTTWTRRGIVRNNYKHRGVTINLPIRLDNNKRITGMSCGGPAGRGGTRSRCREGAGWRAPAERVI